MKAQSGKIRIIAGQLRGRILRFPDAQGLRPTPDRVRETLFNWLTGYLDGAHCLDLYAGSGALGIEALSRGAAQVVFAETQANVAAALKNNLLDLGCAAQSEVVSDGLKFLLMTKAKFDIIFLDPPYDSKLLQKSIDLIDQQQLLNSNGWVYYEYSHSKAMPQLPASWIIHRQARAGEVRAVLCKQTSPH